MAARGLQLGRIDMAIVAGALYYHVDGQIIFSKRSRPPPVPSAAPLTPMRTGWLPEKVTSRLL